MKYRISHETEYRYTVPVDVGQNQVTLRPRDIPRQRCLDHTLDIEPSPSTTNVRTDYFGNATVLFNVQLPHTRMIVTSVSDVEVNPSPEDSPESSPPWEDIRAAVRGDRSPAGLQALQFVFDSPLIRTAPALTAYAAESFTAGRPVLAATRELTHRIFTDFKYDPTTTTVSTPVDEVFTLRSGVCQDFAHLQIAMLRGLGLPTRYVSGYLRTFKRDGDPKLIGADASHAWLSVFDGTGDPETGWTDFDPTNNQVPGEHHVTVAWGRDYADVSPVKGVIVGGGEHTIDVRVEVKPIDR
ncbi:MAG: transglutaminase family protein [Planctomycetota bacterium]